MIVYDSTRSGTRVTEARGLTVMGAGDRLDGATATLETVKSLSDQVGGHDGRMACCWLQLVCIC